MKQIVDVRKMALDLHNAELLNLKAEAKSFIDVAGAHLGNNGGEAAEGYLLGWEHYVVICGAQLRDQGIREIESNLSNIKK